jgi:hypothetical protein
MKLRVAALVASLTVAGCAVATDDYEGVAPGRRVDGGSSSDTGSTEDEDTGTTPAETDSGSSSADDTGTSAADSESPKDSGSAPIDSGAPPTDSSSGTPCSTLTAADCTSASSIGSVSGDTGSGVKTATGTDSKFVRVTVTEDDSAVFSSKDPKARITLKSTGGNFDLYVYLGPSKGDGGGVECTTLKASATEPAADDVVSIAWNDNRPIGGHDDTRVVTIEVRATMPSCAGASWTLTVEGNK